MITVIIGHRGVGKTALLNRIKTYFDEEKMSAVCIDLDSEISKSRNESIQNIFDKYGEGEFRKIEKKTFQQILDEVKGSEGQVFVSVGAGFDVGSIGPSQKIIWLRRKTDAAGRVFLDRPSLEPELSPLEEFKKRADKREILFARHFDEELTLPEGLDSLDQFEKSFFIGDLKDVGGVLTLLPENFRSIKKWQEFIDRRLAWNFDYFEVRDDLLDPAKVEMVFKSVPFAKILYSFRKREALLPDPEKLSQVALWDWPLELGRCPFGNPAVVSIHERTPNESMEAAITRLEAAAPSGAFMKLAVHAHNFKELETGYRWMCRQTERACFLPRSLNGRWSWFRLLMKGRFDLNFVREGMGSAIDQPHLLEWVRAKQKATSFAAVLGYPVLHSRTPLEHDAFFRERGEPIFSVPVGDPEWDEAIPFLEELGLKHAAVTSPLKEKAYAWVKEKSPEAKEFEAVNTLYKDSDSGEWVGHSTDNLGLRALVTEEVKQSSAVVVWGGGGVLSQVRDILPQAQYYSARTGEPREGSKQIEPEVVLWAAPRAKEYFSPPSNWKPRLIVDLNYREDSSGRDYALLCGAKYVSGLEMFKVQAQAQREFWNSVE